MIRNDNPKGGSSCIAFYCPAEVYLFSGATVRELIRDPDLFEDKANWDDALVLDPTEYAVVLDQELQKYRNGMLNVETSADPDDALDIRMFAHCSLKEDGSRLWLRIEYPTDRPLSKQEIEKARRQITASIEVEGTVAQWPLQWGWLDTDAGALLICFRPVEDWSFSSNGYRPAWEDFLENSEVLTESEWECLKHIHQPQGLLYPEL